MAVVSFKPPAITCAELLAHASKDNTLLYLSLLPREIRDFIDPLIRWSAWRAGGMFVPCPIRLPVPGDLLAHNSNAIGSFERIVLPNGDEVYHSQQHYLRIRTNVLL